MSEDTFFIYGFSFDIKELPKLLLEKKILSPKELIEEFPYFDILKEVGISKNTFDSVYLNKFKRNYDTDSDKEYYGDDIYNLNDILFSWIGKLANEKNLRFPTNFYSNRFSFSDEGRFMFGILIKIEEEIFKNLMKPYENTNFYSLLFSEENKRIGFRLLSGKDLYYFSLPEQVSFLENILENYTCKELKEFIFEVNEKLGFGQENVKIFFRNCED